jgi:DNA-binding IclR family transcriptional regulator
MATAFRPAKAKAAQRVIEVLDFFDEQHRQATVMDIARRYNRPQSSTSELLASLVDLGLLYKDCGSRSYTLTPRAAILGSLSQPRLVQDGRLTALVEDLRERTGLGVALIGMVGTHAQIFRWKSGARSRGALGEPAFFGGAQDRLQENAAGWLLLSTLPAARREGLLRRLNAEAPEDRKFVGAEMSARVADCAQRGTAIGPAGFGSTATMAAVLLPGESEERPMAVALIREWADAIEPGALVPVLEEAIDRCIGREETKVAHAA